MPLVRRFEDLQCWQKARQLTNMIYDLTGKPRWAKDFQLRDQIRNAAGSVMHNIAEGFDSGSRAAYDLATEAKRLVNGMMAHLRKKR